MKDLQQVPSRPDVLAAPGPLTAVLLVVVAKQKGPVPIPLLLAVDANLLLGGNL